MSRSTSGVWVSAICFSFLLLPLQASAWWWKYPNHALRIEVSSGATVNHPAGKPAVIQGRIRLVDPVSGKYVSLPKNFAGSLEAKFYFPSKDDLLSGVKLGSHLDFRIETPAVERGELNVLSIEVGQVSKQTRELQKQETKLAKKAHALRLELEALQRNPKARPLQIAATQAAIALVDLELSRLRRRIAESMEIVASYDLPLLVDDGPAEPARSTSLVSGFLFETRFDPSGVPFAGQSVTARTEITDLRHRLFDVFGRCDRTQKWELVGLWNGKAVAKDAERALREGESMEVSFVTPALKVGEANAFGAQLTRVEGGKKPKITTLATYAMALEVSPPFTGPTPQPLVGLPSSVSTFASRTYTPQVRSDDGILSLPTTGTFEVPTSLTVVSGNAGNGYASLQLDQVASCLYQGGSKLERPLSTPKNTAEITKGQKYNFLHCKIGALTVDQLLKASIAKTSLVAGGKIRLFKTIQLHIEGGDRTAPTFVQADLKATAWEAPAPGSMPSTGISAPLAGALIPGRTGEINTLWVAEPATVTIPESIPVISGDATGAQLALRVDDQNRCTYASNATGNQFVLQSCVALADLERERRPGSPQWSWIPEAVAAPLQQFLVLRRIVLEIIKAPPRGPVFIQPLISLLPPAVLADTVPPAWTAVSPLPSLGYITALPPIQAVLRDTLSPIDPGSVRANLNGQDVTFQLTVSCNAADRSCSVSGSLSAPEGALTLTLTGKDSKGNASAPYIVSGFVDRTGPQWQLTSPVSSLGTVKTLPAINATLQDARSPVEPSSLRVRLIGVRADGAAVDQDVTALLARDCTSRPNACVVTGSVPAADGTWTLSFEGRDVAGNASVTATAQGQVDATPPQLQVTVNRPPLPALPQLIVSVTDRTAVSTVVKLGAQTACQSTQASSTCSPAFQEGANAYQVTATDAAGNITTSSGSVTVDRTPPAITIAVSYPTADKHQPEVAISVSDASSVSTTAQFANGTACTSTQASFVCRPTFVEGQNAFTVTSTDAFGNRATENRTESVDTVPPSFLTRVPSTDTTQEGLSLSVSGTLSEKVSEVIAHLKASSGAITATTLQLAANGTSYSGTVVAAQAGNYSLTLSTKDLAGNSSTSLATSVAFQQAQPAAPILATSFTDHVLLSQTTSVQVPVTVTSAAQVRTRVLLNGAVVRETDDKAFTLDLALRVGRNRLEIRATDEFGTEAAPLIFTDLVLSPPALESGLADSAILSPAFNMPSRLSDALLEKLSLSTSLLALATGRSDPFSCSITQSVSVPVEGAPSLAEFDALAEVTPEIQRLATLLGSADRAYFYVRDEIGFLPRFGATQTALQTLRSGVGTAADKAAVLIALYRALGIPAQYMAGDILVPEEDLKSRYGVESANDLAWAQYLSLKGYFQMLYPSGFDGSQMALYRDGKRAWQIPHIWVHARIELAPGDSRWIQVDPSVGTREFVKDPSGALESYSTSSQNLSAYLSDSTMTLATTSLADFMRTYGGQDLGLIGLQDLGPSVLNRYAVLPEGVVSAAAPCITLQSDVLPPEYQFSSHVRVGSASQAILEGHTPLGEISGDTLALLYFPDASGTSGQITLKRGNTTLASGPIATGQKFPLYHAIQEPLRYGGLTEARVTPSRLAEGVHVIRHTIAPVSYDTFNADLKVAALAARLPADPREKTLALLNVGASLALTRGSENDRLVNRLRGIQRYSENLLVVSSPNAISLPTRDQLLPMAPSSLDMDWDITGPLYSQTGGFEDFNSYTNIANAKGDLIAANSSLEHQVWEHLFGGDHGVSAIKLLRQAAESPLDENGLPILIRGESLTADTLAGITARFGSELQKQASLLGHFTQESPFVFTRTENATTPSGWKGSAVILLPSVAMGQAGAYLVSPTDGVTLGGNYLISNCDRDPWNCSWSQGWEDQYGSTRYYGEQHSRYSHICVSGQCTTTQKYFRIQCDSFESQYTCFAFYYNFVGVNSTILVDTYEEKSWSGGTAPTPGAPPPTSLPVTHQDPHNRPNTTRPQQVACGGNGGTAQGVVGQPVNLASGAMWHTFNDFEVPGRTPETHVALERTYTTRPLIPSPNFGANWWSNWDTQLMTLTATSGGGGGGCTRIVLPPEVQAWLGQSGFSLDPPECFEGQTLKGTYYVWVDESGGPWTFSIGEDMVLQVPPGLGATIFPSSEGTVLKKRNGTRLIYHTEETGGPAAGRIRAIVEPHGERIDFAYDSSGKLETITEPLAGLIRLHRNAAGLVDTVTRERDGLSYSYSYGTNGKLASSSDFESNTTRYTYNSTQSGTPAFDLLTSIEDPLGRKITYTYYDDGKSFEQTEPGNGYRAFFYSGNARSGNRMVKVRDIDGNTTEFRIDANDLVSEVIYPDQTSTKFAQNPNGSRAETDETGAQTLYNFDDQGNFLGIRFPDQSNILILNDPVFGKPNYIHTPAGTTTFAIDPQNGDVTLARSEDTGLELSLSYDTLGKMSSVNNGRATYSYSHDGNGLLTQVFDSHNPETRTHDARGRVKTRSFASGRILTYTYDDFDQITRLDDSAGPSIVNIYDKVHRLIEHTLTDGTTSQTTKYTWDDRDRLVELTDALGRKTQIVYDKVAVGCDVVDKPSMIIDPQGRKTHLQYDQRQRLAKKVDANGGVTRFEYNARGDLTGLTDPENHRTKMFYDANRRKIREERPSVATLADGSTVLVTEVSTWSYDPAGRTTRVEKGSDTSATKHVIEMEYDALSRLSRKVLKREENGIVVETQDDSAYTYQPQLDASLLKTAENGVSQLSFGHEAAPPYHLAGYSVEATDPANSLQLLTGHFTIARDSTGEISGISSAELGNLLSAEHDPAGRLSKFVGTLGSRTLQTTLTHDGFGRKRGVIHNTGLMGSYSWDLLNRSVSVYWDGSSTSGGPIEHFSQSLTYNTAGNIERQVREFGTFDFGFDALDRLTSLAYSGSAALPSKIVNRTMAFDFNGNRVSDSARGSGEVLANFLLSDGKSVYQPDESGTGSRARKIDRATGAVENFSYRADQRLTSYSKDGETVEYKFDALGRRVAKVVDHGSEHFTQSYLYEGDRRRLLMGKAGNGDLYLYLNGQKPDEHLGHVSSNGEVKAYVTDYVNSVLNTDVAGSAHAFGAHGELLSAKPVLTASREPAGFSWQGLPFDPESEMPGNDARPYDSLTGRFPVSDPLGFAGGTTNLYESRHNNPLKFIDPSGWVATSASGTYGPTPEEMDPAFHPGVMPALPFGTGIPSQVVILKYFPKLSPLLLIPAIFGPGIEDAIRNLDKDLDRIFPDPEPSSCPPKP